MFGRSGQMFPRQRTFHDAIYEEEYGSDNEEECCRCRGLSAILCWFLSVIILVGLAATVVLTVFFILRSRALIVKPDTDLDVEMYGKDQNLFEAGVGGGTSSSREAIGSNEVSLNESGGGSGSTKRKKSNSGTSKGSGRGPPGSSKNDVDADVNDDQNAIVDSSAEDQAENASINHPTRNHPNHIRHNRLQPYAPKTTSTTTTTEAPVEASEEEVINETSEEEEADQNNENTLSGPRNPSFPSQDEEEEEEEEEEEPEPDHDEHRVISAESSPEYKTTRHDDGSPVQQVLFTESPKVTLTTTNPPFGRRFTGRTSFSTTTTTEMPPHQAEVEEEESEEEETDAVAHDNEDEISREDETNNGNLIEKSSEEETHHGSLASSPQTTTSMYDHGHHNGVISGESEMGSESGESQLKQMLLDSIPPHGKNRDGGGDEEESSVEGGGVSASTSASSELNLSQRRMTTLRTTQKPSKSRQDTLSRLISRNFTRGGSSNRVTESDNADNVETATGAPTVTTLGPGGHKYDYTLTPNDRTKLKLKSGESSSSMEQDMYVTKAPPKSRYRSTTPRSNVIVTPEPPSTSAPRTRGTTAPTDFKLKVANRGSDESPIETVPSPDLSNKGQEQDEPNSLEGGDTSVSASVEDAKNSEFLDVLVGSELDHKKTLITKKTDDGVVTSAILPPWYDSNGANSSISHVLATAGTTLSNPVAKVETDGSGEPGHLDEGTLLKKSSEEHDAKDNSKEQAAPAGSEFDRLVNMFSKQESSEETPPPPRFGYKKQKPIVLKKPGGPLASRYVPPVPGRAGLYPTKEPEKQEEQIEENVPENEATEEEVEKDGSDVGRAGTAQVEDAVVNSGYYPENGNRDKVVEHQVLESQRLSSVEMADSSEGQIPSHVIDVESHGPSSAEVVIEQDSSLPGEDEEDDFVEDDYGYGENPNTLSMSESAPNQNVVPAPEDYVRGSGIRRPVSSEERAEDLQQSGNAPERANSTVPTTSKPRFTVSPGIAVRRPAYTREEISKAVVIPSDGTNNLNDETHRESPISGEGGSDEFEEYEDENYDGEGGSVEQSGGGSVEKWSSEKITDGQRWSSPDDMRNSAVVGESPPQFGGSVEASSVETENVLPNSLDNGAPTPSGVQAPTGDYHSKDGWRPVITGTSSSGGSSLPDTFSQEHTSAQSFENNHADASKHLPLTQQQLYEDAQQSASISVVPPPQPSNQWTPEVQAQPQQIHPSPMIPPPIPAAVKFPDSEEDHEDRHHHGRNRLRQQQFDRTKYMVRPVPPPIVMRRHPHASGPFPQPPGLNNRQGPPPQQRPPPQMMAQSSQLNPQFVEPPQQPQPPMRTPLNRNFPFRHNPMRRFNFGGAPQAQPRSAGNIKWPAEDSNGDLKNANNNSSKQQNAESSQSEVANNKRRRRRRRAVGTS